MPPLNIDPHRRVAIVLFNIEIMFKEARDAASEKDTAKLIRKLETAFELINPLIASLDILSHNEKQSLVEKLRGTKDN